MNHYFSGFNTKAITLNAEGTVTEGMAVKLSASDAVTKAGADEKFCGVCSAVRGGYASVVMAGHVKVGYSDAAPTIGYCNLVSDGNGNVKISTAGKEYLVVDVDTTNKTIEIII